MNFSLVVATLNRNEDLFRLLNSLKEQTYRDFNVIIVDQNKSDFLSTINFKEKFDLDKVEIVKPQQLLCASAARNFGAKYAQGDIITFPDDDCWYESTILERVLETFRTKKVDVVSGASIDPSCGKSNAVMLSSSRYITRAIEVPQAGIEYSVFFYLTVFQRLQFDENISPGTSGIFQAGEVTDLLFKIFSDGLMIYYNVDLVIYHPFKSESIKNIKREFMYSCGFGFVLKKHNLHKTWIVLLVRSFLGVFYSFFAFKFQNSLIRLIRVSGRFWGFIIS